RDAARRFAEPRYHFHRRVNWSYRYDREFYAREAARFVASPDAYLSGRLAPDTELADVFPLPLSGRQTLTILLKVLAHLSFHFLGRFADRTIRARGATIYRKCYVDDIELVFDPRQSGVVRAVYPFPINLGRQLRYLRSLRRQGLHFKLDGNPYLPGDVARFVRRRDVRSLMRMESRAQIRQAARVTRLGMTDFQLSDEFDIGSLDFTRRLARAPVRVVNSAHGVGKYFPVHGYPEFHVLTRRQEQYYHAVRPCRYSLRRLNDNSGPATSSGSTAPVGVSLVFLSQTFGGLDDVIARNEAFVLARLRDELAGVPGVRLFYKPHPNRKSLEGVAGFERLTDIAAVNGAAGTLFASFFSTCQIDPAFKGRKVLLRGDLIHPEIAFDDDEIILDVAALVDLVRRDATASAPRAERAPASRAWLP
ncbi:MAG: hypothetical protein ABI039_07255, partial [Vicinamibacterales bacterium]